MYTCSHLRLPTKNLRFQRKKMKPFVVRRVVRHTYVRKETTVKSSRYCESNSTSIHLQMTDEMPNAIKDTTECLPGATTKPAELGPSSPSCSGLLSFKMPSRSCLEENAGNEKRTEINRPCLQVLSMLITSLYAKLLALSRNSLNRNWRGRPSLNFDGNLGPSQRP